MAVDLKLRYCPVCETAVEFDWSNGAVFKYVRWRCTDQDCPMADEWRPLDGWNE